MSHTPLHYSVATASASALAAMEDMFDTGDNAVVASLGHANFSYDASSSAAIDDVTVIDGPGGSGRWLRTPAGNATISADASYYVSATTGNDASNGSAATPFASFGEVTRRIGSQPVIRASVSITFLDASVSEDIYFAPVLQSGGRVVISGTRALVGSGTITAPPTKRDKTANVFNEISDDAQTWAPFVGMLWEDTATGAFAWLIKDVGGHKVRLTTLAVSDPTVQSGGFAELTNQAQGDSYALYSLTTFTGLFDVTAQGALAIGSGGWGAMWVQYATFAAYPSPSLAAAHFVSAGARLFVNCCRFESYGSQVVGAVFSNCFWASSSTTPRFTDSSEGSSAVRYGGSLSVYQLSSVCLVIFSGGFLVQSAQLEAIYPGAVAVLLDAMVSDWPQSAFKITGGATAWLDSAHCLSGSTASPGSVVFRVAAGSAINIAIDTWQNVISARGDVYDFSMNGYTSGSPYVPGSGLLASEVSYTFAHLDAAAGVAGFGKSTTRQDAQCSMTYVQG